jgi:tetratricopeptide (TPR) repeat protein
MRTFQIIGVSLAGAALMCAAGMRPCAGQQTVDQEYIARAREFYRDGQKHMRSGNFTAANDAFIKAETVLRAEAALPELPLAPEAQEAAAPTQGGPSAAMKPGQSLDPDIYYNLGVGALQKGDFVQAEAAFLRVAELDPLDKESCYNLGVLYEKYLDKPKEALKYYTRYISLSDESDRDVERVKGWIKEIDQRVRE